MSPIQMAPFSAIHTPTSDVMDRHEYGVTKNRKPASTGGGRAWSEDEEMYLLQTRLQKMPYKHIAARLKKTELACRLHYHQLSHGSNRRKRTASVSSGSSPIPSPVMDTAAPSPARDSMSRSDSPACYPPASPPHPMQLPSLIDNHSYMDSHMVMPPRLPAILPKPSAVAPLPDTRTGSPVQGYPALAEQLMGMGQSSLPRIQPASNLHIDCATRPVSAPTPTYAAPLHSQRPPPTPPPPPAQQQHHHLHVDMARLCSVYNAHYPSFWAAVASDYGSGLGPAVLEQVWKQGSCCPNTATPITPISNPDASMQEQEYERLVAAHTHPHTHTQPPPGRGQDKTRISDILGIDANPRSLSERELVRRMEKERGMVA